MKGIRITFGVWLGIMMFFLAASTVSAQGAGASEKKLPKQPASSEAMVQKVLSSLHPIRDGMTIVSIDADGVKVWTKVKKADWSDKDYMVVELARPYALLVPISQPSTTEAADKGGSKKPTPSPTPEQCYNVIVCSNGELCLDTAHPYPCPKDTPKK